jgi:hypothetical protein
MTNGQRAMQVWSVLVEAARNQRILSYSTLADLVGLPQYGLAPILGAIQAYCQRNKLPPLTAIVINESTGLPGDRFPAPGSTAGIGALRDQSLVFVFDWLKQKPPSEDDF